MLFTTLNCLFGLCGIVAASTADSILVARQATNNCSSVCDAPKVALEACITNTDPHCGCATYVPIAMPCYQCLKQTNLTLDGFLDATTAAIVLAGCQCPTPACDAYSTVADACVTNDPKNQTCACPAAVKYGPDCFPCWIAHDQTGVVAPIVNGQLAFCQKLFPAASASASGSAAPSGSATASAAASQSSMATFTSGAMAVAPSGNYGWLGLIILTLAFRL